MSRTLTARLEALERKQRQSAETGPDRVGMNETQGEWVYTPAWIRAQYGIDDPLSEATDAEYGGLDQLSTVPITLSGENDAPSSK